MNKLLQSISIVTLLSCAFAGTSYAHIGDLLYVRGDVSWSKFNNLSIGDNIVGECSGRAKHPVHAKGGKFSHKYNFGGIVGVGYLINNKLRAEVVYNRIYADRFKYSNLATGASTHIKADINPFFGRVAYDVIDLGLTQLFIGGGLGIANVRHKITGAVKHIHPGPPPCIDHNKQFLYSFKSKNRNNIAYSLTFGAATKVMDDLRIEAAYSFTDYGHTSRVVGISSGNSTLRSHNISLGLRYDLM